MPVSLLPEKMIPAMLGRNGSVAGREPVSLLLLKSRSMRRLLLERVLGISPEMLVRLRKKYSSLVRLAMVGGIGPTRLGLLLRERKRRKGRLVMEGGI